MYTMLNRSNKIKSEKGKKKGKKGEGDDEDETLVEPKGGSPQDYYVYA